MTLREQASGSFCSRLLKIGYPLQQAKLLFPNVTVQTQAGSFAKAIGIMRPQFHQQDDLVRVPGWDSCQTHGWFE